MPQVFVRAARPFERVEPYAFFVVYAVVFVVSLFTSISMWTWFLFMMVAPGLIVLAWQHVWRRLSGRTLSVRRTAPGVELVDGDAIVHRFTFAGLESVAKVLDRAGRPSDLRVDRKEGKALLFEPRIGQNFTDLARLLGLEGRVRSRYRALSMASRFAALPSLLAIASAAAFLFNAPPDVQYYAAFYLWLWLPLLVLTSIQTTIYVGRDGVEWRWLFVRRFVPFAAISTIVPGHKNFSAVITTGHARRFVIPIGKAGAGALAELLDAFREYREADSPQILEEWLVRGAEEPTLSWIVRLRAKAHEVGAYRGRSFSDLWTFVEGPAATPAQRCGAALVLAHGDGAKARIHAAAAGVASSRQRKALEAIADGASDDAISRLLEDLS